MFPKKWCDLVNLSIRNKLLDRNFLHYQDCAFPELLERDSFGNLSLKILRNFLLLLRKLLLFFNNFFYFLFSQVFHFYLWHIWKKRWWQWVGRIKRIVLHFFLLYLSFLIVIRYFLTLQPFLLTHIFERNYTWNINRILFKKN